VAVSFECRTQIAAAVETVFDLSLSIDAHVASMRGSGERAVDGVTSGAIGLGEQVTWRAKHFGLPFTMTSKIVELDRPVRFVDEQVRGPFRQFRHEHCFEGADDTCVMIDRIRFAAPLGPLGWLAERLVLGAYLPKLIAQRNDFLKAAAESSGA
jgi:ligand-binding SRPBCC domain-containing protein